MAEYPIPGPSRSPDTRRAASMAPDAVPPVDDRRIALVDLLDRLLAGGVVAMGDIELSIADVPLVRISLRAVIASVSALAADTAAELGGGDTRGGDRSGGEGR